MGMPRTGKPPRTSGEEQSYAQMERERNTFGDLRDDKSLSMITVRLHPTFRQGLRAMAKAKDMSLNLLVRQVLLDAYQQWAWNKTPTEEAPVQ